MHVSNASPTSHIGQCVTAPEHSMDHLCANGARIYTGPGSTTTDPIDCLRFGLPRADQIR
ncbi:hypothetical protein DB30_06863 [Enhygromyxa salina]|uniref:Uncharacterized protein n=1 Tax=Enhygromyxa salina TaxID=215803 RepID=A0A0C1ZTK1_9BACT|nr:hypothetical protein DB30_06863 [Enhygromyxa salina]